MRMSVVYRFDERIFWRVKPINIAGQFMSRQEDFCTIDNNGAIAIDASISIPCGIPVQACENRFHLARTALRWGGGFRFDMAHGC